MGGDTSEPFRYGVNKERQAKEYKQATKKQKDKIITRYCKLTEISRNLTSKRFRKVIHNIHPLVLKDERLKKKHGGRPTYTSIHKAIVKKAWELSDEICGERLHPVVKDYIKQLEKNGELKYYGKRYITETIKIFEPILKRIIVKFPKANNSKKNKGNCAIYKQIPISVHFGKNTEK